MKRYVFAVLSLFPVSLMGAWVDITDMAEGPRASVGKKEYLQLSPATPVRLKVKRSTNVRWRVRADKSGRLWYINRRNGKRRDFHFRAGKSEIRMHLSAGIYDFYASPEAVARVYRYVRRRWKPVQPEGGGYPVVLLVGENRYTYYRTDRGVVVKVKGPTTLHLFFRAFMRGGGKVRAKIKVYEGKRLIKSAIKTLRPSRRAIFFTGKDSIKASVPLKLSLKVSKGLHRYRVVVSGVEGAVKPYVDKGKRKRKRGSLFHFTEMGRVEYGPMLASLSASYSGKRYRSKRHRRRRLRRRRHFKHHYVRVVPSFAYLSSDNVYHYSQPQIDTFYSGLKPYRYPGVEGIGDGIWRARLSFTYLYRWRRKISLGPTLYYALYRYLQNQQLNRSLYGISLVGRFYGLRARVSYLNMPFYGVRPTYTGVPKTYELLSFAYSRTEVSLSYTLKPITVRGVYGFGRYDFNPTFDLYDARFRRAGGGITFRYSVFSLKGDVLFGKVEATNLPAGVPKDWSHDYTTFKVALLLSLPYVSPYISYRHTVRNYTTTDVADSHYGREDKESDLVLGVSGELPYVRPFVSYRVRSRSTTSPTPIVDVFKDYRENVFTAGIRVPLKFRF